MADVDSGNLRFDADALEAVRWTVNNLWIAAGQFDAGQLPQVQRVLSVPRVKLQHAAALMLPFVDDMKPRIEQRLALAGAMMARYC